jgi:hypothetical protein
VKLVVWEVGLHQLAPLLDSLEGSYAASYPLGAGWGQALASLRSGERRLESAGGGDGVINRRRPSRTNAGQSSKNISSA